MRPNIFEILNLQEPSYSAFLGTMLKQSHETDGRLFDAFWEMATPGWPRPGGKALIRPEDYLGKGIGRIDLTLEDVEGERLLGVEVKTQMTSTTSGQLQHYREGLVRKYRNHTLAIAFLTPFNRKRAGDVADSLRSVREFEKFQKTFPHSTHLSWLDLADIDWDGDELWEQYRAHIRSTIASDAVLDSWKTNDRPRHLETLFGAEAAETFDERLRESGVDRDGGPAEGKYKLDLTQVRKPAVFADAFRALVESEEIRNGGKAKKDTFAGAPPLNKFLRGRASDAHFALFQLAAEHENVWIEGRKNYSLRVTHPHPKYARGAILLTSSGEDEVWIEGPKENPK